VFSWLHKGGEGKEYCNERRLIFLTQAESGSAFTSATGLKFRAGFFFYLGYSAIIVCIRFILSAIF
jgi:hypothetical protein